MIWSAILKYIVFWVNTSQACSSWPNAKIICHILFLWTALKLPSSQSQKVIVHDIHILWLFNYKSQNHVELFDIIIIGMSRISRHIKYNKKIPNTKNQFGTFTNRLTDKQLEWFPVTLNLYFVDFAIQGREKKYGWILKTDKEYRVGVENACHVCKRPWELRFKFSSIILGFSCGRLRWNLYSLESTS